jgi:hypothetical protein
VPHGVGDQLVEGLAHLEVVVWHFQGHETTQDDLGVRG